MTKEDFRAAVLRQGVARRAVERGVVLELVTRRCAISRSLRVTANMLLKKDARAMQTRKEEEITTGLRAQE